MKYSTSLFRMTNLAHAFITVLSVHNIFVMEICSSGTLSRIHAPHRIGWPVLTYRSPIALDENIRSIYRLPLKSLSCVIQTSLVASFKRLVFRYVWNIYSNMSRWSHVSKTRDLKLKRDTTSSLNICCDVIRDIVQAWSTSSLSFTRDVIQAITRVLRKPWSLMDLGETSMIPLQGYYCWRKTDSVYVLIRYHHCVYCTWQVRSWFEHL